MTMVTEVWTRSIAYIHLYLSELIAAPATYLNIHPTQEKEEEDARNSLAGSSPPSPSEPPTPLDDKNDDPDFD